MEPTCRFLRHAQTSIETCTTLAYRTLPMSASHFMMVESSAVDPLAVYLGNLAGTILMMFPPGGATTFIFIADGADAVSSFVMRSKTLGRCSCRLTTRHWRTNSCGCSRHTSCCSGKRCRAFWNTAGTTLRRNGNVQHRQ